MFGIGPSELLVIAVVAVMLFSPRELPKVIKGAARLWGSIRRTADEFRDALMQDEELGEIRSAYKQTRDELGNIEREARVELMRAQNEARRAEAKLREAAKAREQADQKELPGDATDPAARADTLDAAPASEPEPTADPAPPPQVRAPEGAVAREDTLSTEAVAPRRATASPPPAPRSSGGSEGAA